MENGWLRRANAEVLGTKHGGELRPVLGLLPPLTLSLAQVFVTGDCRITFADTGDVFNIRKPSSFV